MTLLLWTGTVILAALLALFSFVQLLYLESLRLRAREQAALEYFKETLAERIALEIEAGMLAFSLIKHSLLVLLGVLVLAIAAMDGPLGWAALAEGAGAALAVMLAAAYFAPQLLYRKTNAHWLAPLAPLLRLAALVMRPLTSLFDFLLSLAALNEREEEDEENGTASEDLEALIDAGADEGLIEEGDRRLIQSVVELSRKTVREVMTPRPNMVAIHKDATIEDLRAASIETHFSRFPVYAESIDDVLGFIHIRDMVRLDYDKRAHHTVAEFLRPVLFVPETKPVDLLFREMQRDNIHLAIVVDEYGETAGLASMEDVVEEVFGEIRDEHDVKPEVRQESGGAWLVAGQIDLDHLRDLCEFRPGEETESTTIGGLVTEWLGHLPRAGEVVERDGIRLEVTEADERVVKQVRVSRSAVPDAEAAHD